MPKSRKHEPEPPKKPSRLVVSREDAKQRIESQIGEGESLLLLTVSNEQQLEELRGKEKEWTDFNEELLLRLFDSDAISKEYSAFYGGAFSMRPSFTDRVGYVHKDIKTSLGRLRSIVRRLDLFDEPGQIVTPLLEDQSEVSGSSVFVVHGHDESTKQSVARLLEHLDLKPIILHEQTNEGRTLIEKFEEYSDVAFAVILLTPDDLCKAKKDEQVVESSRARQNVIFELGYFIGKLGRKRVCALYAADVELPSDMSGVLYIPLDPSGSWKFQLARELKAVGLDVDLNKVK